MNKLLSIKEVTSIDVDKEKYRNWINSCNNSPLKSPNYSKVLSINNLDELYIIKSKQEEIIA